MAFGLCRKQLIFLTVDFERHHLANGFVDSIIRLTNELALVIFRGLGNEQRAVHQQSIITEHWPLLIELQHWMRIGASHCALILKKNIVWELSN